MHAEREKAKAGSLNAHGFLALRMNPNAQYEIRMFAEAVGEIIAQEFPKSWSLFANKI